MAGAWFMNWPVRPVGGLYGPLAHYITDVYCK